MNSKTNDELVRLAPGMKSLLVASASVFALALSPAFAQSTPQDDDVEVIEEEEDDDDADSGDAITVTGSRIRRDTFTSISPLQVISTEQSLDVGLIDPAAILQESTAAAGQQIDSTFNGFVLDNGPGSQTLNLRGLGASRTLILINGRRMAPAGVEGAPTQPSINLLPGSLIERYDLLLDGASSVYGSDAVAGVGNAILRKDFEGFELFASGDYNQQGAGNDFTISGSWGKNTDRGFIGVGVEYDFIEEVTVGDRDFLAGCVTHQEITEDGQRRTLDIATALNTEADTQGLVSEKKSPCLSSGSFNQRFFEQGGPLSFGSAYYTPGRGNLLSDYSDTGLFSVPIDSDGDGLADIFFPDFVTGNDTSRTLFREQQKFSAMAYGEYTFEGAMNITPFFEALYVNLESNGDSGDAGLFPDVPANNPFNPCNPNQPDGVDCNLAENALLNSPSYIAAFQAYYSNPNFDPARGIGGSSNCFGLTPAFGIAACNPTNFGLIGGPAGPQVVQAGVSVRGDRTISETILEQTRGVLGVRGDLPAINFWTLSDWNFEASLSYSYAEGQSDRPGIRDDRLLFALGWDPTTDLNADGEVDGDAIDARLNMLVLPGGPCDVSGLSNPSLAQPDLTQGCVAVNMFAPSLLTEFNGEFATQAERDYLFDVREFNTVYEQTVFNAFVGGNLFELPAGNLSGVAGVEYRIDSIDSQPDTNASEGLFFGFFSDLGASGEKWTREAFFEVSVPLLANKPLARQLDVNAAARWTEDEFYGSAWTYSAQVGWRPVDSLLLKSTVGTSFRAPNLRENFINGQTGFTSALDPCAVPAAAVSIQPGGGFAYDPSADPRRTNTPQIFDACVREGRDPTAVGFDPASGAASTVVGVEVQTGGTENVQEETSESFTAGFSFEQPWFDGFDLNLNLNFYDIEIENSIIEPSAGFLIADCFLRETGGRSLACDRLTYGGSRGQVSFVEAGFINQDKDTVTGIDYNITFNKDFTAWNTPMDFGINVRANQLKERGQIFINPDTLDVDQEEFAGEFGFPEWTGFATFTLDVNDKYRFTWNTRYIGDVEQDAEGIDLFGSALGFDTVDADGDPTIAFADTCGGPEFGDVLCRDVGFAEDYFEHTISMRYQGDTWRLVAGIDNLFDKEPPLVDPSEVFSVTNVPIGNGYDLDGRQFFVSFRKDFN